MDEIFGKRFIQRGNDPAWHHKGFLTGRQKLTAEQMLQIIGSFELTLQPLYVWAPINTPEGQKGMKMQVPYAQIIRMPTEDDPYPRFFGEPVSIHYELITPERATQIWDSALTDESGHTVPTETLGVLKGGREMFISALIGSADIMGDQVDQYLVFYSPMYSNKSAILVVTVVRPVCQNTLTLGIKKATSKKVIPHTPGAGETVKEWISSMYAASRSVLEEAKDDMIAMAKKPMRSMDSMRILTELYPDPPVPQEHWDFGLSLSEHQVRFEAKRKDIQSVRQTIMDLFGGDGFGQDTDAAKGTAFGLYNAIAEYEDNRKGTGESRALGVTVGDRAAVVRRAYMSLMKFSWS